MSYGYIGVKFFHTKFTAEVKVCRTQTDKTQYVNDLQ